MPLQKDFPIAFLKQNLVLESVMYAGCAVSMERYHCNQVKGIRSTSYSIIIIYNT